MADTLTWYNRTFKSPNDDILSSGTILLDIGEDTHGMKRGGYYLNGINMGHYNNVQYNGLMVQRYYFIPKDYLMKNQEENSLIFIEQLNNVNLTKIAIVSSTVVVPN